ncbi:MAG: DNA methylase [Anaerolineae bacterium]|nr:DNA methylase [Anaerolineae bacterium]
MPHQPQLISEPKTPYEVAREAEREAYLEKLRQHLQDPEFRAIEGFPIGEDKDILELSDPPYYTACPNPFMVEIAQRWQIERTETRQELWLPDDRCDDGNKCQPAYQREPFAADVREGRSDAIYRAHTYHTKVPHKAIMRYILHYTDPGDVVLDGFCGTGMTGVAAQLCGNPKEIQELGYQVDKSGRVLDGNARIAHVGVRKALLVDLSPIATFVAHNYSSPLDTDAFHRETTRIVSVVEDQLGWMYETWHPHCDAPGRIAGRINYTIWSDVFVCSHCGEEMIYWDVALDKEEGRLLSEFPCPNCDSQQSKRSLEHALEAFYDRALSRTIRRAKQVPVVINYIVGKQRYNKTPDKEDLERVELAEQEGIGYWFPTDRMPEGEESRRNDDIGLTHVHHFYTQRNLTLLSALWEQICSVSTPAVRHHLQFCYTAALRATARFASIAFSYYFHGGGGAINAGTKGTLYVSSTIPEVDALDKFRIRASELIKVFSSNTAESLHSENVAISTQSSTTLHGVADESVDYVFIDPPFGGNLMYSELSFYWEAWLKTVTNNCTEAVVNEVQGKGLPEYQRLMERCFREFHRALKPDHWMTVEFHNSQNRVWNAIQEALQRAGFVVADVRTLDKKQGSFKQYTSASAVRQDLIISAYKPHSEFERCFVQHSGRDDGVWEFVRQHLTHLPVAVEQDEGLEIVAEREAFLLYDRMIAFHIQRGFTVPMGAAEFYAGLKRRFPERDSMYFLPEQAAEYDKHRLQAQKVEQLALFVTDEKSALQWLRRELDPETGTGPQTYQDLQPKFLRELHQARHEDLPELGEMLAQSFLQDDADRWYLPDPARQEDLEQLRERALLREFAEYAKGKGRLRTFRTEAVRAGFKHAWSERAYHTIVDVAERLPTDVLQEDPALLMYYDNALLRVDEEPEQGTLW